MCRTLVSSAAQICRSAWWTPSTVGQTARVSQRKQKVTITLWRADAIVLYDWLMRTDLSTVPIEHPAEKQALADFSSALETQTESLYGAGGSGITQDEVDEARAEVARDMGW
jgi:hypothetical protein